MKSVEIYTDGACRGNPGPGGWGALLVFGDTEKTLHGGEQHTTNNRMEISAAIFALEALNEPCQVELTTDSKYVLQGATEWMKGWKRKNWRTASGSPVKNIELWQRLEKAMAGHDLSWKWVRGHTGHEGNERADQLANQGIDELS